MRTEKRTNMIRVAAATPRVKVADIKYNKNEILKLTEKAEKLGVGVIVHPELTITGYTVGDLLHQSLLYERQMDALFDIMEKTKNYRICIIIGCYIRIRANLFNCAAVIHKGELLGIVPKTMLPNNGEFTEMRWFDSGSVNYPEDFQVEIGGELIPFGPIVFEDEVNDVSFGIEICRDIWTAMSPSAYLAMAGAKIIFNPSASTETAGKAAQRRSVLSAMTMKSSCAYIYTSCGVGESTTDGVFAGHRLIVEDGAVIAENARFERESDMTISEIDIERINFDRIKNRNITACKEEFMYGYEPVYVGIEPLTMVEMGAPLIRTYGVNPWLPGPGVARDAYCEDVFNIQAAGLAKRMEHIGAKKTLLGVSGGLDSTMALMVACEAHRILGYPVSDVIAITLPGFGTTDHTHDNAVTMMKELGVDMREVSIKEAVLGHFRDIGHDKDIHDLTYENAQARERTQILMDIAGKEGALMVGTGDLSEIALGWCTYNGDHMAMYGVNGSIPKTMLPHILEYVSKYRYADKPVLTATIQSVIDTPISPELLPPDENGDIAQKTEDKVGPYVLHDFFIFHTMISGWQPSKMMYIAEKTFDGMFDKDTIRKWLRTFYYRFFSQQFKRNCAPDCPKATQISLASRGDLHMASDTSAAVWLAEFED